MLKTWTTIVLLTLSFHTSAQDLSNGGTLQFSIDWERTFDTLTLREYFGNRKTKIDHCKYQYQNLFETTQMIDELANNGELDREQLKLYREIQGNLEAIADSSCEAALGKRKSRKLKEEILK